MIISVGKKYWTSDRKSIVEITNVSTCDTNDEIVFYNKDGVQFNMNGESIDFGDDLVEEFVDGAVNLGEQSIKVNLTKPEIVPNKFGLNEAKVLYSTLIDRMMEKVYEIIYNAVVDGLSDISIYRLECGLSKFSVNQNRINQILTLLQKDGYVIITKDGTDNSVKSSTFISGWAENEST